MLLKKELEHATGFDTANSATKKDFVALKAEVDKLDIKKLFNVPTSLNNFKTKVDDLEIGEIKTVPVDLKKLSDAVDNQVAKNTKFNTLKTKVNKLDKKVPDGTTLIYINQCNADKKKVEKKIEILIKIPDVSGLVTTTVIDTKIKEVDNKISDPSRLVKKTDYDAKILEIEGKCFNTSDYNKFMSDILDTKIKQKRISQQIWYF